jgi:hypothetical protein
MDHILTVSTDSLAAGGVSTIERVTIPATSATRPELLHNDGMPA